MPHYDDPVTNLPNNRLEFKERVNRGPFQPKLQIFPRTTFGNKNRSFHQQYYEEFPWLEYSPTSDSAYCFPCRMFKSNSLNIGQSDEAFTTRGFKTWSTSTTSFKKHQKTKSHFHSTESLSNFHKKSIDVVLDEAKELVLSKRESDRLNNRSIMQRLIDITILLAKTGKPFRGHNENLKSDNRGMFLELAWLLKKYDPTLKQHLAEGPKNATYTSNLIQNDLILSIHSVLKRKLVSSLKNKKISIMADETSDCGHHEQMSVIVRYYDDITNSPVEYFVCMMRLTAVDSQSIFDSLSSIVEKQLSLSWLDVVAVCFDGAATMAGCSNGVQSKCKEINSKIFYVHCHAHCLNLVLVDSIGRKNRIVFDFFGTIQFLYSFIEGSCIRHATLEKVAKEINLTLKTLKSISTTRWACRFEAVAAVKNNYLAIISAIQNICDTTKIPDVRSKSRGLLMQLQTFEFIFALNMLHPLLLLIVKINSCLQAENLDLLNSLNMIKSLKLSISQLRSDDNLFKKIYNDTVECCTETGVIIPQVKKRKISSKIDQSSENQYFACTKEEDMKVTSFNVVLDDLLNGLNDRFNQETLKLILAVMNVLKLEPSQEDLLYLNNVFGIDSEQIQVEIMLLKNIPNIPSGTTSKTLHQWIDFLNSNNRTSIFLHFYKVIVLFTTIPVTTCSCERAFSKLTIVKTKLRSTMTQERLDALMFLFIEQQMTTNINYDEVIEEFKVMIPTKRRLEL